MEFLDTRNQAVIASAIETSLNHVRSSMNGSIKQFGINKGDVAPQQQIIIPAFVYNDKATDKKRPWGPSIYLFENTAERLKNRDGVMLVVAGSTIYNDVFGMPHQTDSCVIFRTMDAVNYEFCAAHNTIR